ncbi:5-formyltetrahydrofolate cyclo-ligase [Pseudoflavonifractor phocaeensis]|uniref:5-formyltetrahydrofolate cyclo-ligase n=1 Tax=Pseudoflavonifractor phocaeensis TaxID=1870988 RepID=UPI0019585F73|nr:5-formyltetrahydrofolate cyclo-ligase [Pseudoflavonifractor phocaeensis]MBM6871595.1 5-formyltetrahydrofolate cyclo-ligase [Pseudoflavonifractor phocaeensis]MBM6939520.1 5-formyltetrahydrofolate cyclo-ligase [Pseudoflavonifractor phocaeensis]
MASTTTALSEQKAALRARLRQTLSRLSPEERKAGDQALFARFLSLPQLRAARRVLLYCGMGSEPDTRALLPRLWDMGKETALPRCLPGHAMEARLVGPGDPLVRHPYGMLEPSPALPLAARDSCGLILVPGLAFDRQGRRLGQGGGYYDRYLPGYSGLTVALCRDAVLLDRLPAGCHDQPVALVLTESACWPAP